MHVIILEAVDSMCTWHAQNDTHKYDHLVLSVCCFPNDCLLNPLMSPEGKKC